MHLLNKAWTVFSQYIRLRDNGVCFTCGDIKPIKYQQAGHFISRRHHATLFDEMNVHCQCAECNQLKNGNLEAYERKLNQLYGERTTDILRLKSRQIIKFSDCELEEKIRQWKTKIKLLKNY